MPKITDRTFEGLLHANRLLASAYTPEWKPADEDDLGLTLLKIFSHMQEEVSARLNRVPEKGFGAFLDMLGMKLMPAQPARVPVTFFPAEGLLDMVFVPAGTRVATDETEKHGALIYETVNNITSISATIAQVLSIDPKNDKIYCHTKDLQEKRAFSFFEGDNVQEHILYMGHSELFKVKGPTSITLGFEFADAIAFDELDKWKWQANEKGDLDREINPKNTSDRYSITLIPKAEIKEDEIKGIKRGKETISLKSFWVACSVEQARDRPDPPVIKRIQIEKIASDAQKHIKPDMGFYNFIPLDIAKEFLPFSSQPKPFDALYLASREAFSKKGADITMTFEGTGEGKSNGQKLSWEYWNGTSWQPLKPDVGSGLDPVIFKGTIKFNCPGDMQEIEINGEKNYWIRVRLVEGNYGSDKWVMITEIQPPTVTGVDIYLQGMPINPEPGFYNSKLLDLTKKFQPFGGQPKVSDVFYMASRGAFSGRGGKVSITFHGSGDGRSKGQSLSWEYWNGTSWQPLKLDSGSDLDPANFRGKIIFDVPQDIQEAEINKEIQGIDADKKKNFWIRASLISGDYSSNTWVMIPDYKPPSITRVDVDYQFARSGTDLQYCLSKNNLEYRDVTSASRGLGDRRGPKNPGFRPFLGLQDDKPAIYLGFNRTVFGGNISLFFSILGDSNFSSAVPGLGWYYWGMAPDIFEDMKEDDEIHLISTEGIGVGTDLLVREVFNGEDSAEMTEVKSYQDSIIALNERKKLFHLYTRSASTLKRKRLEAEDGTDNLVKSETLRFIGPSDIPSTTRFGKDCFWLMGILKQDLAEDRKMPAIAGIYPNTVWAEQVETIRDEILGSSKGEMGSIYKFLKRPVISPEIWVREGAVFSQSDKEQLNTEGLNVQDITDRTGKAIDAWVRWKAVDDLFDSGPKSRHYVLDAAMGEATFGNGKNGLIPPLGRDNIRASYRSGGGIAGNVGSFEIKNLRMPVAGIDRVTNYEPAEGGSDPETMESVFERGPHLIKNMDRAVTVEDFEWLAKAASSYVARAKCVEEGRSLNIIIIPRADVDKPMPSPGLIELVEKYLLKRSPSFIPRDHIAVHEPNYKEIRVKAEITPKSLDNVVPLEKEILRRLKEYLHPLTGGGPGKGGWEFGRGVHRSDVYALLQGINGVDHIKSLELNDDAINDVEVNIDETICSGEHRLTMVLGR